MNNNEFDNTGYGAIIDVAPELKKFVHYSEKSFRWFIESTYHDPSILYQNYNYVFNNICCIAKNTSFSIRLLSSWMQPIEAYMLLRIRLDQLINCSYLIHEKPEIGILAYMKYYPKIHKQILNSLQSDELLKDSLKKLFPQLFDNLGDKIKIAENHISQELQKDDLLSQSNWTKYSIRDRAKERDKLVQSADDVLKNSLENLYVNIFKVSSSVVHSDAAAVTNNFYTVNESGILIPQMHYVYISIIYNALMDIIECYELSTKFGFDLKQKYHELYNDFLRDVKNIEI